MNSTDTAWLEDTACAELEVDDFFVDAGHVISEEVLEICRTCPVRRECVTQAYVREIGNGYFAGISPSRRDKAKSINEIYALIDADPPTTQSYTSSDDSVLAASIPAALLARLRGILAKSMVSPKKDDYQEYRSRASKLAADNGLDLIELEALGIL